MLNYIKIKDGLPFVDLSTVTPEQAAAIQEIVVETTVAMKGESDDAVPVQIRKVRFKLVPKTRALEAIGRHFKMFVDRKEVDVMGNLGDRLNEAIRRAREARD